MSKINTINNNYRFVGTPNDLIENGFSFVPNNDIYAIKRFNDCSVFITGTNLVLTFNGNLIQDLIDKGLVVLEEEIIDYE